MHISHIIVHADNTANSHSHTLTHAPLWLQGYRKSSEFIITQTPLAGTVKDFWTMVWQNNAQVLVSLPDAPAGQVRDCRFLLSHHCCRCC